MRTDTSQSAILFALHRCGAMSRAELHRETGIRPTTVGVVVDQLTEAGLVRACTGEAEVGVGRVGRGRPAMPVEIDPVGKHLIGLALKPGWIEVGRTNLRGGVLGRAERIAIGDGDVMTLAAKAVVDVMSRQTVAVGISAPGFIDLERMTLLMSSVTSGRREISFGAIVEGVDEAAARLGLVDSGGASGGGGSGGSSVSGGGVAICLDTEVHAVGERWRLTHHVEPSEDVLLVSLADGAIGASMMIEGKPNAGCVLSANELGHCRWGVATPPCYCGHTGCIERLFSSDCLPDFETKLSEAGLPDAGAREAVGQLAMVLANFANFVRPARLVLAGPVMRYVDFADELVRQVRGQLLSVIGERLRIERWAEDCVGTAESAAWLPLAMLMGQRVPAHCAGTELSSGSLNGLVST